MGVHMYDEMLSYAECDLIPRFRKEHQEHGTMAACPKYQKMKDFMYGT